MLDNPLVQSIMFYPRRDKPSADGSAGVYDGTLPVEGDIVLGYRLYVFQTGKPVIVFFHGNGEIASDYDGIAPLYHQAGASLLVVDYRGYGWSTGRPLASTLLSDTEAVYRALPETLGAVGLGDSPLVVMGRSLGSATAIHLAYTHGERFKGLIVESGFASVLTVLVRLGLPPSLISSLPDPFGNARKMQAIQLPLLVIHGERDSLIPVANGEALYKASPAETKRIVRIQGAGHNDLLHYGAEVYFEALSAFIRAVVERG